MGIADQKDSYDPNIEAKSTCSRHQNLTSYDVMSACDNLHSARDPTVTTSDVAVNWPHFSAA
jgi:hypothetical protein